LGALAGVGEVKYDCKTATVTMKGDATLVEASAAKALKDAGFGMTSFASGPPPTVAVVRASVKTKSGEAPSAAALAKLSSELGREVPEAAELLIEVDGRLTIAGKPDAKLEAKELSTRLTKLLEKNSLVLEGAETRAWPKSATLYVSTLRGAVDAKKSANARATIENLDNVLAAVIRLDGSWLVVTREPCSNLEERLRSALKPTGVEVVEIRMR
jgi:hypothetical protein